MKRRIAIIGGGLAGLAAAIRLAEHDCIPIVIESRKRLGGRATSLHDPRTDRVVDNCQHVLMGCCTALLDLYARLGVMDQIHWDRQYYWTADGQVDTLQAGPLPAPIHMAWAFQKMRLYRGADRRAIARGLWKMIRMGSAGRLGWRDQTFESFLQSTRPTSAALERFWKPIVVSACNLPIDQVAADMAIQVFQEGFLANRFSSVMGLSSVPLASLYDPAWNLLEQSGGEVHLGLSARGIAYDGRRVSGVVTADGVIQAAAVVAAVPFDRLDKLISDPMRRADQRLQQLDALEVSPILGVHVFFDQAIMDLPHLTLVERSVHWIFNKGVDRSGCQHLHAVISAADSWMGLTEEEIAQRVVEDIRAVLPRSVGLEPLEVRAIKEKRATFAATPGVHAFRPPASPGTVGIGGGGIENLFLAGDWCDTGWPATMEGAVRSGYAAADGVVGVSDPVRDVPPGLLSRLLGLGK